MPNELAGIVVAAAQDPSMPRAYQEAIVAAVPRSRLLVLENAAHLASFEQPDAVNALITDHLTAGPYREREPG